MPSYMFNLLFKLVVDYRQHMFTILQIRKRTKKKPVGKTNQQGRFAVEFYCKRESLAAVYLIL